MRRKESSAFSEAPRLAGGGICCTLAKREQAKLHSEEVRSMTPAGQGRAEQEHKGDAALVHGRRP